MEARTLFRLVAATLIVSGSGCGLVGPTCVARQERGSVTALDGEVAAGQVVSHAVRYDVQGSQNDAQVSWDGYRSENPPRLRFYATRVECTDFLPPPAAATSDCAVMASAGWTPIGIATTLIVTHGRGNPESLGSPPEYKIWVVGEAERSARYSVNITWFYGPDC